MCTDKSWRALILASKCLVRVQLAFALPTVLAGWLCVLFLDFALSFLPLATFTARFPLRFLLFCLEFKIQKFIAFVSAAGTATTATTESVLAFSIGSSRKPGIGIV